MYPQLKTLIWDLYLNLLPACRKDAHDFILYEARSLVWYHMRKVLSQSDLGKLCAAIKTSFASKMPFKLLLSFQFGVYSMTCLLFYGLSFDDFSDPSCGYWQVLMTQFYDMLTAQSTGRTKAEDRIKWFKAFAIELCANNEALERELIKPKLTNLTPSIAELVCEAFAS